MTTSGNYSFTVSRDDLITEAMKNVGALGESETPTAQEVTDCALKLNMLVKGLMGSQDRAPGLKMWQRQRGDLFLSSGKGAYLLGPSGDNWAVGVTGSSANYLSDTLSVSAAASATTLTPATIANYHANDYLVLQLDSGDIYSTTISSVGGSTITVPALPSAASSGANLWNYTTKGQRPLEILTCVLRDINGNDTPLDRMTLQDYEALPSKAIPSYLTDPTAFYYQSDLTNGTLYLDMFGEQDVTKHLHIVYLRPVQDFTNPADNPEYPQAWFSPLAWGLSKLIAPMFDAEWTQDMEDNRRDAMMMAQEADPDATSMYFQANAEHW